MYQLFKWFENIFSLYYQEISTFGAPFILVWYTASELYRSLGLH